MLNMDTARKIGVNACIDKLGRNYVLTHKDSAASAYGQTPDGMFCFVGVGGVLHLHRCRKTFCCWMACQNFLTMQAAS